MRPVGSSLSVVSIPLLLISIGCGTRADESRTSPAPRRVGYQLARELAADTPHSEETVDSASVPTGPRSDPDRGVMAIPYQASVDFYLRIPRQSAISVDRIQSSGRGSASLQIEFERSGATAQMFVPEDQVSGPVVVDLPDEGSEICRLTFSAASSAGAVGSLVLFEPVVLVPSELEDPPLAPSGTAEVAGSSGPETKERHNIILIVADTLRADHLGAYGYEVPISPNLDALARESVVFDDVIAQAPWTKPSIASIFTGLAPNRHGVKSFETSLSDSLPTLAEILDASRYRTVGFIANAVVRRQFGFAQGFDVYSYGKPGKNDAEQLMDRVLRYLDSGHIREPFFFYLHALDPHSPYDPPESQRQQFAAAVTQADLGDTEVVKALRESGIADDDPRIGQLVNLYDAEIASFDEQIGRFIEELKNRGFYEDSLIIFASDHGEEFWDRGGWGHGHSFFREVISVPLFIKSPGATSGFRSNELVQHLDLFPTVLDYAGIETPSLVNGRSLRPLLEGESALDGAPRHVFSSLDFRQREGVSLTDRDWKLIVPRSENLGEVPILIDRRADPDERRNLFTERPVVSEYMLRQLARVEAETVLDIGEVEVELDAEMLETLKALGYL